MARAHHFMPGSWQTPKALRWLRRTHGWLGLGGAVAGVLFSLTTLFMQYENFGLSPVGGERTTQEVRPPAGALVSEDAFGNWAKEALDMSIDHSIPPTADNTIEPLSLRVRFVGSSENTIVEISEGDSHAVATTTRFSFIDTLNRFHRVDAGVPLGWRILSDAFAGAMIVLAITGTMMWTRFHGPRLLGLGLFSAAFVVSMIFITITA